jgi:hypothetical protein
LMTFDRFATEICSKRLTCFSFSPAWVILYCFWGFSLFFCHQLISANIVFGIIYSCNNALLGWASSY